MFIPATTALTLTGSGTLFAPNITTAELSDTEKSVMHKLSGQLLDPAYQNEMKLSELYYLGLNVVPSLGISIPPELEPLRAILGWCAAGVDARCERLGIQGFRLPGSTEVDDTLQVIWQANNFDAEAPLAHDAALQFGRCYGVAGPRDGGGAPLLTIESPLTMIGSYDPRTRELSAAYQTYRDDDPTSVTYNRQLATLYTRTATIQLVQDPDTGRWVVQDRNDHNMGIVPAVQFAPRASLTNRLGRSEMGASWRNTQDRACRNLVRMEVTGEFYATMKIFLLGVTEQSFKKPDGSIATAWETFIGRISTLQADAMGNLPEIKTIAGQSPDGFVTTLDQDRQIMAGHTGLAPQYLGIYSDGNPASADAIRMSDFRLARIAERLTVSLGNDWESLMRIAMIIAGEDGPGLEQLETDWDSTGIPTPSADTQSMATQVGSGMVPATADDVLAKVGWTPVQRKRLADERDKAAGLNSLDQALSLAGLGPAVSQTAGAIASTGQAADGEQPAALTALAARRSTDAASAG